MLIGRGQCPLAQQLVLHELVSNWILLRWYRGDSRPCYVKA